MVMQMVRPRGFRNKCPSLCSTADGRCISILYTIYIPLSANVNACCNSQQSEASACHMRSYSCVDLCYSSNCRRKPLWCLYVNNSFLLEPGDCSTGLSLSRLGFTQNSSLWSFRIFSTTCRSYYRAFLYKTHMHTRTNQACDLTDHSVPIQEDATLRDPAPTQAWPPRLSRQSQ